MCVCVCATCLWLRWPEMAHLLHLRLSSRGLPATSLASWTHYLNDAIPHASISTHLEMDQLHHPLRHSNVSPGISPLPEHTKASNSNDGAGCTGEVGAPLPRFFSCKLVSPCKFGCFPHSCIWYGLFTCCGFNQTSELSPLEKGWLCLLVLGSSSLLAMLLLPFPLMTIIITLQQK